MCVCVCGGGDEGMGEEEEGGMDGCVEDWGIGRWVD